MMEMEGVHCSGCPLTHKTHNEGDGNYLYQTILTNALPVNNRKRSYTKPQVWEGAGCASGSGVDQFYCLWVLNSEHL